MWDETFVGVHKSDDVGRDAPIAAIGPNSLARLPTTLLAMLPFQIARGWECGGDTDPQHPPLQRRCDALDPQIQALLDRGTGVPATHTLPVAVARAQYEARIALMAPAAEIAGVREQTINGLDGKLCIRLYTPHGAGRWVSAGKCRNPEPHVSW
jgi:hypothetical protein